MFRALNTESASQKKKAAEEGIRIREMYMDYLFTSNLDALLSYPVQCEQNIPLMMKAKSNALTAHVKSEPIDRLNSQMEQLGLLEFRNPLFLLAEKNIQGGNFVRAKKILNVARDKGWFSNRLYDLSKRIEVEYFGSASRARYKKTKTRSIDISFIDKV